jgi:nucleolar protein 56
MLLLVTTWFGTFVCEDSKVVHGTLFPQNLLELRRRIEKIQAGEILEEEKELVAALSAAERAQLYVTARRLLPLRGENAPGIASPPLLHPEDFGVTPATLRQVMITTVREKLAKPVELDFHIIHAVNTLSALSKTANLLNEHLMDWYSAHWPELKTLLKERKYADFILRFGTRTALLEQHGLAAAPALPSSSPSEQLQVPKHHRGLKNNKGGEVDFSQLLLQLKAAAKSSTGAPLSAEEVRALRTLAEIVQTTYIKLDELQEFVTACMKKHAPNLAELAGPILGARLIAAAGGLQRLARLPAGTIQLLGAEKALFRHLREGTKPPKHGIIYEHPLINRAPSRIRGKLARAFAAKLALAARVDCWSKRPVAQEYLEALKARAKLLLQAH